jgi:hypothetical protein
MPQNKEIAKNYIFAFASILHGHFKTLRKRYLRKISLAIKKK